MFLQLLFLISVVDILGMCPFVDQKRHVPWRRNFCRDKIMFVVTNMCLSWQNFCCNNICLNKQFCHDKHTFVTTNTCLSRQNISFVSTKSCLSRQVFVVTEVLLRQNIFVATKVLWWQAYFCHDKRCVLLWQTHLSWQMTRCVFVTAKIILVAAPANDKHGTSKGIIIMIIIKW